MYFFVPRKVNTSRAVTMEQESTPSVATLGVSITPFPAQTAEIYSTHSLFGGEGIDCSLKASHGDHYRHVASLQTDHPVSVFELVGFNLFD